MLKFFPCVLLCGMLTGCAGMNSDFDCNKTTTDQCLSMSDASKLASQGKSLDDLTAEKKASPKPAGETLTTPANTRPAVSPARKISAATPAPRPALSAPGTRSALTGHPVSITAHTATQPVRPADYASAGHVSAQRIPDSTQRLWIAPWVDEQDSFHQPAVVEFVKQPSRWDQDFRVISEGD